MPHESSSVTSGSSAPGLTRRTIFRGAAWAVPVVAVAAAAPMAAASDNAEIDLEVVSTGTGTGSALAQEPARVQGGVPVYRSPGTYNFYSRFRNNSSVEIPAGTVITVSIPNNSANGVQVARNIRMTRFETSATNIGLNSGNVTALESSSETQQSWVIGAPIPAGAEFTFQFGFDAPATPNGLTGGAFFSSIQPPAPLVDENTANDSLRSPRPEGGATSWWLSPTG